MTRQVTVWVPGTPVPQGSKKAFVVKGRAVIVDVKSAELKAWRQSIIDVVQATGTPQIEGPVSTDFEFRVVRPKTVTRPFPSVAPDLDKYVRAANDALTQSGLIEDDSRICASSETKKFAPLPGVLITIRGLAEEGGAL